MNVTHKSGGGLFKASQVSKKTLPKGYIIDDYFLRLQVFADKLSKYYQSVGRSKNQQAHILETD